VVLICGFDSIILRKFGPKGRVSSRTYDASQATAPFSQSCSEWQSLNQINDGRVFLHRCSRRPKGGSEDEAIGRSRGGLSTKISIAVDTLGNPVRFILTAGQVADIRQAEGLIEGLSLENLLADKGYDADRFRASIEHTGRRGGRLSRTTYMSQTANSERAD
jgi:Transposase DDE domain